MSTLPSAPRSLPFAILDVFAERPLQGNALAVFSDASGLTTAQMQELARETNLSETTFIVPRDPAIEQKQGVHVRIFTTHEELPFAGHPTLGTATWLHLHHPRLHGAPTITLDLAAGRIPVTFSRADEGAGLYGTMRQNDPVFGHVHEREAVANAIGLDQEDLDPDLPIQTVSTGLPFCIVPLRSLDVAHRLAIPQHRAAAYLTNTDAKFFHCICRASGSSGSDWHARMQFYNGEDPATGSASGCTAAYLVANSLAGSEQSIVIEQGVEMIRPSRIYVRASMAGAKVHDVFVSGRTILAATGSFFLS